MVLSNLFGLEAKPILLDLALTYFSGILLVLSPCVAYIPTTTNYSLCQDVSCSLLVHAVPFPNPPGVDLLRVQMLSSGAISYTKPTLVSYFGFLRHSQTICKPIIAPWALFQKQGEHTVLCIRPEHWVSDYNTAFKPRVG